ncbi:MAG: tetratricopeptide repeat protein [Candidatus Brocadiia bacterium]
MRPTHQHLRTVALGAAMGLALAPVAAADGLTSWESLQRQRERRGGLFAQWGADQEKVLDALREVEHRRRWQVAIRQLLGRLDADPSDLAARDLLGRAYLRIGQVALGIHEFRRVLSTDPTFRSSRINLATAYRQAGRLELAAAQLAELVALEPDARETRKALAELYTRMERYEDAARVLRKLVSLEPDDLDARVRLARALVWSGRKAEAKAAVEAAIRLAPEEEGPRLLLADYYRFQNEWDEARATLAALHERRPGPAVAARLALVLLQQRRFEEAAGVLGPDTELQEAPRLHRVAAIVAAQGQGDLEGAIRLCSQLHRGGDAQHARPVLAHLWLAKGDAQAIRAVLAGVPDVRPPVPQAFQRLVEATRDQPETRRRLALLLNIALAFDLAGWRQQAVAITGEAQELAPGNALVADFLAMRHAAAGQEVQAVGVREQMADDHPESPDVLLELARAYRRAGKLAAAEGTCRRALRLAPQMVAANLLAAQLAFERGDYAAAVKACQSVLAEDPAHEAAFQRLLSAVVATQRFADAQVAVLARQDADRSYVPGPLARALVAAGAEQYGKALAHCQTAVDRSAYDWRLRLLAGLLASRLGALELAAQHLGVARLAAPDLVPARLESARVALRLGRVAEALETYRTMAAAVPHRLPLQLEYVDALSQAGRPEAAITHLLSLEPRTKDERHTVGARLAQEYLREGNLEKALEEASGVLAEDPAHEAARHVAVGVYRRRGDLTGAAKLYERLLEQAPDLPVDSELGLLRLFQGPEHFADAAERLERAARDAEGARRYALLKWQAAACLGAGQLPSARAAALEAQEVRPEDAPPSPAMIVVLAATGAEEAAGKELERLATAGAEFARWLDEALARLTRQRELATTLVVGYAAGALGWRSGAVKLFEAAHEAAPEEPAILHALAMARRSAGALGAALEAARELVRLRPQSGEAQMVLANLLELKGEEEDAGEAYRRAAERLDKKDLPRWYELAQWFADRGEVERAVEAYRAILAVRPEHAPAANNLAWLYAVHKPDKLDEAQRLAAAAVRHSPRVAAYRDTLGWVLFLRKDHAGARRELEAALELAPATPTYLYHLGMVRFAAGQREAARRLLSKALEIDPGFPDAHTARATLKLIEPESQAPEAENAPKP